MWCACLYLVDRAYGGPEEGGWYYDCGEPEPKAPDGNNVLDARFFTSRAEAYGYIQRESVIDALGELNKDRPGIGHSNSEGIYEWHVTFGMPKPYPEVRPHYE